MDTTTTTYKLVLAAEYCAPGTYTHADTLTPLGIHLCFCGLGRARDGGRDTPPQPTNMYVQGPFYIPCFHVLNGSVSIPLPLFSEPPPTQLSYTPTPPCGTGSAPIVQTGVPSSFAASVDLWLESLMLSSYP